MSLGLAVRCGGISDVYVDHLLFAGADLRACCLAPVQARRSVAPPSSKKSIGFGTLFLSAKNVLLLAHGYILGDSRGSLDVPPGLSGGTPRTLRSPPP